MNTQSKKNIRDNSRSAMHPETLALIEKSSLERKNNPIDFFSQCMASYFQINGKDRFIRDFARELHEAPWSAEDMIICLKYIAHNPPTNLVSIIEDEGRLELYNQKGIKSTYDDYVKWLKHLVSFLEMIYNSPPHNESEIIILDESFKKSMNEICDR